MGKTVHNVADATARKPIKQRNLVLSAIATSHMGNGLALHNTVVRTCNSNGFLPDQQLS